MRVSVCFFFAQYVVEDCFCVSTRKRLSNNVFLSEQSTMSVCVCGCVGACVRACAGLGGVLYFSTPDDRHVGVGQPSGH